MYVCVCMYYVPEVQVGVGEVVENQLTRLCLWSGRFTQ